MAEPLELIRLLREPCFLVGLQRDREVAAQLEVAVDLELAQGDDRAVEVLASEALQERASPPGSATCRSTPRG